MPGRKVVHVYLSPQLAKVIEDLSAEYGIAEAELCREGFVFYVQIFRGLKSQKLQNEVK